MIYHGNALDVLRRLPSNSVHCAVTSPPYYSLRDYGVPPTVWGGDPACAHDWTSAGSREGYTSKKKWQHSVNGRSEDQPTARALSRKDNPDGWNQIEQGKFCTKCSAWLGCLGLEPTPELYVTHIVDIFEEIRRVLRKDGTCWLNLGDSFATNNASGSAGPQTGLLAASNRCAPRTRPRQRHQETDGQVPRGPKAAVPQGLKPKDLIGLPWMVAFALRAAGWYLRMDIIWSKTNPMPESVKDRPVKSHEYMFLLTKSESYFYDAHAVREGLSPSTHPSGNAARKHRKDFGGPQGTTRRQAHAIPWTPATSGGRNLRSVWQMPTAPFKGAHFATFPPRLVRTPILAGTSAHGCCPKCGAGFKRMTCLGEPLHEQKLAGGCNRDGQYHGTAQKAYAGTGAQDPSAVKKRILDGMRERITVGWRPTCDCGGARIRPGAFSRRNLRRWYRDRWQARIDARWGGVFGGVTPAVVLDPFGGSGTTRRVAEKLGRAAILIELNPDYIELADAGRQPAEVPA